MLHVGIGETFYSVDHVEIGLLQQFYYLFGAEEVKINILTTGASMQRGPEEAGYS
jgi:hypothetical protein